MRWLRNILELSTGRLRRVGQTGRRARLEESRKLWQFYWDMADEENWIKEKEQILSTGDIGHDPTTIHLVISKHRSLEEDIASHEPALYAVVNVGEKLIQQGHFGQMKFLPLSALNFYKLFSEADGVEQWIGEKERMLETMVPARDIEDVEVMRHRYDGFDREMNANASRPAVCSSCESWTTSRPG